MIRIEHIAFEFTAPDEAFARGLYADWDDFCQRCFERVAEECLAPYGNTKVLYEMERLDLDLGNIPEEDFYAEYPRRLREALLAALPPLYGTQIRPNPERTAVARTDNLLHYLTYGHPLPEWADKNFDLRAETDWLGSQSSVSYMQVVGRVAELCLRKEYAIHRLLRQTAGRKLLLDVYAAVLVLQSAGVQEKKRFLTLMLEVRPDIPLCFVHGVHSDGELQDMAELLDSLSVKILMREETGEHAEVDLPPYWHYLYEWLIKYYPFNGIAIFGGKREFIRHLNHRLLTFIRKRNYSFYLSKVELTFSFLLEVFGPVYYIDVLNAIYELQSHNPDGSPVYDSYFNRELYLMFLRLSLLRLPQKAVFPEMHETDKKQDKSIPADTASFVIWLKDTSHSKTEKRALLITLAKECPEQLINWLESEAGKDAALLSLLASLANDAVVDSLLASMSFTASESVASINRHLHKHKAEIPWLKDLTDTRLEQAVRQSVLSWMAKKYSILTDGMESLLRLLYREVTGGDDENTVGKLVSELRLSEGRREYAPAGKPDTEGYTDRLRKVLSDASMPGPVKRREAARFWDVYRDNYAEAVRLLHTQGMLPGVLEQTEHYTYMEIIRGILSQMWGGEKTEALLSLLEWLVLHEETLSLYVTDSSIGLRYRLLLWTVHPVRGTVAVRSLLSGLFGEGNLPSVLKLLTQDMAADGGGITDIEKILAQWQNLLPSTYMEWLHSQEENICAVRLLLADRWQTTEGFEAWLDDAVIFDMHKRELLQTVVIENPREWIALLRRPRKARKNVPIVTDSLPATFLLQSISRISFHQAAVLSRLVSLTRRHADAYPFLSAGGKDIQSFLSEALLLYMQDEDTLDRTLTEKDIVEKFFVCLCFAYTGKREASSDEGWQQLAVTLNTEMRTEVLSGQEDGLSETLSGEGISDTAWRHKLEAFLCRHPDKLLLWMENGVTDKDIDRLADAVSLEWLKQWVSYLSAVAGFVRPDAFRHWAAWLFRLADSGAISAKNLAGALCAWVKETDWKRQTPGQMEKYFLSRLSVRHAGEVIDLSMESVANTFLPEDTRRKLLRDRIRLYPEEVVKYIRRTVTQNILSVEKWAEWLDAGDWMRLASNLSLSVAELFRQVAGILQLDDRTERLAWATCITESDRNAWLYNSPEEQICLFVETVAAQGQGRTDVRETVSGVMEKLHIPEMEDMGHLPEIIMVGNAGLCLLVPWLVRLFAMLGYLDEERKKFRDTASKVRAVFLLQYLACGEEKVWREGELALGRLLTALSEHVPLPKRLPLTDEEKQTADSMVDGVKANWPQMGGTSVTGFRHSFILRDGTLEQEEERWLLTVKEKAYDILLETVPWSFRQIRLPWLKKYVQVKWNEKQEF